MYQITPKWLQCLQEPSLILMVKEIENPPPIMTLYENLWNEKRSQKVGCKSFLKKPLLDVGNDLVRNVVRVRCCVPIGPVIYRLAHRSPTSCFLLHYMKVFGPKLSIYKWKDQDFKIDYAISRLGDFGKPEPLVSEANISFLSLFNLIFKGKIRSKSCICVCGGICICIYTRSLGPNSSVFLGFQTLRVTSLE